MKNHTAKERAPILLLEDDPLLSLSIKDLLESMNYQVYAAETCSEALKNLELLTINVALGDKMLPDGEGTAIL